MEQAVCKFLWVIQMHRKGISLGAAPMVVMTLIMLSVVSVVGLQLNDVLQGDAGQNNLYTKQNESLTSWTNGTYKTLTNAYAIDLIEIRNSTDVIYNKSSEYSSNATLAANRTASAIRVHWTSGISGTVWKVDSYDVWYQYYGANDAGLASGNATKGISEITGNLSLVGIMVIMAIVIGLLFAVFATRSDMSGL